MLIVYWQSAPPFTLLSSDALPTAIDLSVADMSHSFVRLPTSGPDAYEIQFQLVQVPEPGIFGIAGLSLLGFLALRLAASGSKDQ